MGLLQNLKHFKSASSKNVASTSTLPGVPTSSSTDTSSHQITDSSEPPSEYLVCYEPHEPSRSTAAPVDGAMVGSRTSAFRRDTFSNIRRQRGKLSPARHSAMLEDSGVDLDVSQGGISYSSEFKRSPNHVIHKGLPNHGIQTKGSPNHVIHANGSPNHMISNKGSPNQIIPNKGSPNSGMYNSGMYNAKASLHHVSYTKESLYNGSPYEIQHAPITARDIAHMKSSTGQFKSSNIQVKRSPNQFKGSPNQMKGSPNQLKGSPNQMKGSPNQLKGSPNHVKTSHNEYNVSHHFRGSPHHFNGQHKHSPTYMTMKATSPNHVLQTMDQNSPTYLDSVGTHTPPGGYSVKQPVYKSIFYQPKLVDHAQCDQGVYYNDIASVSAKPDINHHESRQIISNQDLQQNSNHQESRQTAKYLKDDEAQRLPIGDVNLCPVHGKYMYTESSPASGETESSSVSKTVNGISTPPTRSEISPLEMDRMNVPEDMSHYENLDVIAQYIKAMHHDRTRGKIQPTVSKTHKRSSRSTASEESDLESVSVTSQEVAVFMASKKKVKDPHHKQGHEQTKSSKTATKPVSEGHDQAGQQGMSNSLASFAEQSILSFLNKVDHTEAPAYQHSTRDFVHSSPTPTQQEQGNRRSALEGTVTPTNIMADGSEHSRFSFPSLHQIVTSYDLVPVTLSKAAYKSNTFGINISTRAFDENGESPIHDGDSPSSAGSKPRFGMMGSAFMPLRPTSATTTIVAVESVESHGVANHDGRIRAGDYIIEVNGVYVVEKSDKDVRPLLEEQEMLNLVIARGQHITPAYNHGRYS